MMKYNIRLLLFIPLILFVSCKSDDDGKEEYTIPTTYNFENVSYTGQTQRIGQFTELKSYMATSQSSGTTLDIDRLLAMYENGSAANWQGTYDESKQIKGKTFENVQQDFADLFTELAIASQSTIEGSEGISGVITSTDGAKSYLIGEDGLDHAQLIEKGLMGALIYYQATGVYMEPGKIDSDNTTIEPGRGTEMEHAFDEAFGYFGVETTFPSSLDNLAFWGNYSDKRNELLDSNQKMMDAFLKGRAAISNDDLIARDEAIETLRTEWELIAVGSALHYLNSGMANFDDIAIMSHGVSEGIGFIYALQFNPSKTISNTQVIELLEIVAGSADFASMNLYNSTVERLKEARDKLADYYNLNDIKEEF